MVAEVFVCALANMKQFLDISTDTLLMPSLVVIISIMEDGRMSYNGLVSASVQTKDQHVFP